MSQEVGFNINEEYFAWIKTQLNCVAIMSAFDLNYKKRAKFTILIMLNNPHKCLSLRLSAMQHFY